MSRRGLKAGREPWRTIDVEGDTASLTAVGGGRFVLDTAAADQRNAVTVILDRGALVMLRDAAAEELGAPWPRGLAKEDR